MAPNVERLEELARTLRPRSPQGSFGVLDPAVIRLLARGEPVAPETIASEAGVSVEEVLAGFRNVPDAEFDDDGNLVGLGLTLRPTPHRFQVGGRQLYTWCALDTLMYPSLIGSAARVESPCHATRRPVRVDVAPGGVRRVEPATAVVSLVAPTDSRDLRASFCGQVHFFSSEEVARGWLDRHPHAAVVPVADAFDLGQALNRAAFGSCCGDPA